MGLIYFHSDDRKKGFVKGKRKLRCQGTGHRVSTKIGINERTLTQTGEQTPPAELFSGAGIGPKQDEFAPESFPVCYFLPAQQHQLYAVLQYYHFKARWAMSRR